MKNIIVITGESGAGKDTLAKYIISELEQVYLKGVVVKFVEPFKKALSVYLDVPLDYLENREYRTQVIPALGCSPLDLMVRGFHVMPQLHPELGLYSTTRQVERLLSQGNIPIFTDMRNPLEAEFLANLARSSVRLSLVKVRREGSTRLSSDIHLDTNYAKLYPVASDVEVVHNTSLRVLQQFASRYVYPGVA